ncbi:hypothetical protein [Rhodoferax antarcticus]|nr:hypothetical protein [Rhodoferax antarcticus]APW46658.1 hypothetical protein RA876_10085 [Rhodoferax antarcticus]
MKIGTLGVALATILFGVTAKASIDDDMQVVAVVVYCKELFSKTGAIVYDRDREDLRIIGDEVWKEAGKKYSQKDVSRMHFEAAMEKPIDSSVEACRKNFAMLKKIKREEGRYLTMD